MHLAIFFLVPLAALLGWILGKSNAEQHNVKGGNTPLRLRSDYFKGLNYLINEQPDKAVDVFVKLLEVDTDTVETHLALGSLFRKRGEVERAIRIHQNLIARPGLAKNYRIQALAALGQDYLSAGVLDRAERVFKELVEQGGGNKYRQALLFLMRIYEQEKDWQKAIDIAFKLERMTGKAYAKIVAQYYCEMAEQAIQNSWQAEALTYLKKALAVNHGCVRASILRGNIAMAQSNYDEAVRCFRYIRKQDHELLGEVIDQLSYCYHELDKPEDWYGFLKLCMVDAPRIEVVLAVTDYLRDHDGVRSAISFITEQIQKRPSLRGLNYLVEIYLMQSYGDARDKLNILKKFIDQLLAVKPIYCCEHCGFSAKTLLWVCPSCHQWESIRPIQGLEGG